jgi:hypothetical protein
LNSALRVTALAAAAFLSACATNIHPQNETITRSKVPLGKFSAVAMRPLAVERSEGDSGDQAAIARVDGQLRSCMRGVFRDLRESAGGEQSAPGSLVIEPSIVDMKKVNSAERFFLGPMVGSSAILLKVRFVDTASNDVLAEPVFYAKANAWGGSFSIGATDNAMLTRIVDDACRYARSNY